METNAASGMFSRGRYRQWLSQKTDWARPETPGSASPPDLVSAPVEIPTKRVAAKDRPPARPGRSDVVVLDGFDDDPSTVLSELS
jgi:hypothetical protein